MSLPRRLLASLSLVAAVASVAAAAPRIIADLTGKWNVSVATPGGDQPSVMTITQKGDSVTGTLESELGAAPMAGVVKGDTLRFTFQLDMGVEVLRALLDRDRAGHIEGPRALAEKQQRHQRSSFFGSIPA